MPSWWSPVRAGDLIVDLGKTVDLSMVGAIIRSDEDGKPRFPVDPKAKIADRRRPGRPPGQREVGLPQPSAGTL